MKNRDVCNNLIYAVPKCLCGAIVANCIKNKCKQSSQNGYPNLKIEKWKRECLESTPECIHPISKKEACNIVFNTFVHEYNNRD